jgi:hypothetical protein
LSWGPCCWRDANRLRSPFFFDRQFIPVGNWKSPFEDTYDISLNCIRSWIPGFGDDWPETEIKGDIVAAVDFSANSGALIIKVVKEVKGPPSVVDNLKVGDYTAVYYSEYTSSQVKMANPVGPAPDFAPIEAETLNDAFRIFTPGNMGAHASTWGTYNK